MKAHGVDIANQTTDELGLLLGARSIRVGSPRAVKVSDLVARALAEEMEVVGIRNHDERPVARSLLGPTGTGWSHGSVVHELADALDDPDRPVGVRTAGAHEMELSPSLSGPGDGAGSAEGIGLSVVSWWLLVVGPRW